MSDGLTPKQRYEERKQARKEMRDRGSLNHVENELMMLDFLDRFVTAVERIADVLEGEGERRR